MIVVGAASASNTSNKSASAACGGATPRAIGGGGRISPSGSSGANIVAVLTESYPSASDTWTVTGSNGNNATLLGANTTDWAIQAYVICAP